MSNNKRSSVEWLFPKVLELTLQLSNKRISQRNCELKIFELFEQAKAMQQEQLHLYAAFVLKCVQNNLPPITFNDWINLDTNEQQ
jgi:hypothetical protein